jgi:hypothetical protein
VARQFDNSRGADALRAQIAAAPAPPAGDAKQPDQEQVIAWLRDLQILAGVPFHYLVPDASMLPPESIRFFQVDDGWVDCLVDGAYSVGSGPAARATAAAARPAALEAARSRMAELRASLVGAPPPETTAPAAIASGFLLRSALVSGWPGMEMTAYADGAGRQPLPVLRLEHVSPTIVLGLFAGLIERLDLREPGEGVHFGVTDENDRRMKHLRYANGDHQTAIGSFTQYWVDVPMRGSGDTRVVEMSALAASMTGRVWTTPPPVPPPLFTAAEFALEMIEGVDVASFALGTV